MKHDTRRTGHRKRPWHQPTVDLFDTSHQRVFNERQLGKILNRERDELGVPRTLTLTAFIDFLTTKGQLREVEFLPDGFMERLTGGVKDSDAYRFPITRFVWGDASPYALGLSLRSGSYLSHSSAVFLHGLTDQIPKTVHVNKEQSPKPKPKGELHQAAINRAFMNAPRKSKYIFHARDYRFVLLSGKNTKRLEVTEIELETGERLAVTKLERTLIDITVRPSYAGGPVEVLKAFQSAKDRISVNTLVATLKKLDYIYPYHQAIGFFMERAGFDAKHLAKLRRFPVAFDFYVTHQMSDPRYSREWRLHYPEGL